MTDYLPTFKDEGTGPPVLFLHGLGGNRHAFDLQIEILARHFRCIAWDTPGYGSSPVLQHLTFDALASCLDELITHLGIEPYAVVGHSMGGMVAQTWVRRGGRTQRLVLAQTSPRFGKPGSEWNEKFLAARLRPLDEGHTPADFAEPLIRSMFHNPDNDDAVQAGVQTMSGLTAEVYRQILGCLTCFDEAANLPHIGTPTLCLAAEFDTTAPAKTMRHMADAIPDACFDCLPNAGHLAYLETPDAFTSALQRFLGQPGE